MYPRLRLSLFLSLFLYPFLYFPPFTLQCLKYVSNIFLLLLVVFFLIHSFLNSHCLPQVFTTEHILLGCRGTRDQANECKLVCESMAVVSPSSSFSLYFYMHMYPVAKGENCEKSAQGPAGNAQRRSSARQRK